MIHSYLDLSTEHITQETLQRLSGLNRDRKGWPTMTIADYDNGCFVTVPPSDTNEHGGKTEFTTWEHMPEDLVKVLRYAAKSGAILVRFAGDGDSTDDLPTYIW